ncbi:MAG: integration host factor subunit alpha [Candidatus Puniceispirillaceae bacterium]
MMSNTLTRQEIANAVHNQLGLSRNESAELVESVLEELAICFEKGEQVKISSFGTFSVSEKTARMGRNPKSGEEAVITPRRVLTFRPSSQMKERVNNQS